MAQVASKTCDICSSALTEHYCIDCEQYFCETCKGLHKRQRATRNHEFQSSSDLIQEVKSKCKEHDEDFIFLCSSCDVPVCRRCISGKHNGHKVANIDDSITNLTQDINIAIEKKLNIATKNVTQINSELKAFDLDVNSVIKEIRDEGHKMKAMIDRVVQKMIDDINSKAKQVREKLTKMVIEAQTGLQGITGLDLKRKELEKTRRDAALFEKLKTLNSDIDKFQAITVPVLPSIRYTPKGIHVENVINLFGTYSLRCEMQSQKTMVTERRYSCKNLKYQMKWECTISQ
ncbi:transcription intermediary factor 1-beta-like [Mytilus californianus]|uniref:transcription intermediary factor 1-beta-like n=1 Tax=Mytilus californianus TaxID=6549 RepID=UPI002247141C|nr:transcription intermediary factor 1-beta-like [Mytilus californianus]